MARPLSLFALLGACDPALGTNDTGGGLDPTLCGALRSYDLAGASCDQLQGVYHQILEEASACHTDRDCQVLDSRCDVFFVSSCHVGASRCLAQADLDAVATARRGCVPDPMASCPEPCPELEAACVEGACIVR